MLECQPPERQAPWPHAGIGFAVGTTAIVPLTSEVRGTRHRHPHRHGHGPKGTPGQGSAAGGSPPPPIVTFAVARGGGRAPWVAGGLVGAAPVAALVAGAEGARAQLGDAISTAGGGGTGVGGAVTGHEQGGASAEQQAGAQGAGCHVQGGDGVLAQVLTRHEGALVGVAVPQGSEAALVAAAGQLARVVVAVGLAALEAVGAAAVGSQAVVGRALCLVVWRRGGAMGTCMSALVLVKQGGGGA